MMGTMFWDVYTGVLYALLTFGFIKVCILVVLYILKEVLEVLSDD